MHRTIVHALGLFALVAGCAASPSPLDPDTGFTSDSKPLDVPFSPDAGSLDASRDARTPDATVEAAADVPMDRTQDIALDAPSDRPGLDLSGEDMNDGGASDMGCSLGRSACGGNCVDLSSDQMHCGACDRACRSELRCSDGMCGAPRSTWSTNATDHDCAMAGVIGMRFTYVCPPMGTPGSVWGTGVYTHDSSVCAAAVHSGRITAAAGGSITVVMSAGRESYVGSARGGVSSNNFGSWRCSFSVVAPGCASPSTECEGVCATLATDALHCGRCGVACGDMNLCVAGGCACGAGLTMCAGSCVNFLSDRANCGRCANACAAGTSCTAGVCGAPPATWSTNATDHDCSMTGVIGMRFSYVCPPMGTPGSVWGTDVYTNDSSVCTAAAHAGRITVLAGGMVTILMAPGQERYTGSVRNGVTSNNYAMWGCSYGFP